MLLLLCNLSNIDRGLEYHKTFLKKNEKKGKKTNGQTFKFFGHILRVMSFRYGAHFQVTICPPRCDACMFTIQSVQNSERCIARFFGSAITGVEPSTGYRGGCSRCHEGQCSCCHGALVVVTCQQC